MTEKIIYNRLYAFLTAKGILHDEQFGFWKHHSTAHALHKSVESIKATIWKMAETYLVFLLT
jgi:hypothetical protein